MLLNAKPISGYSAAFFDRYTLKQYHNNILKESPLMQRLTANLWLTFFVKDQMQINLLRRFIPLMEKKPEHYFQGRENLPIQLFSYKLRYQILSYGRLNLPTYILLKQIFWKKARSYIL